MYTNLEGGDILVESEAAARGLQTAYIVQLGMLLKMYVVNY